MRESEGGREGFRGREREREREGERERDREREREREKENSGLGTERIKDRERKGQWRRIGAVVESHGKGNQQVQNFEGRS